MIIRTHGAKFSLDIVNGWKFLAAFTEINTNLILLLANLKQTRRPDLLTTLC